MNQRTIALILVATLAPFGARASGDAAPVAVDLIAVDDPAIELDSSLRDLPRGVGPTAGVAVRRVDERIQAVRVERSLFVGGVEIFVDEPIDATDAVLSDVEGRYGKGTGFFSVAWPSRLVDGLYDERVTTFVDTEDKVRSEVLQIDRFYVAKAGVLREISREQYSSMVEAIVVVSLPNGESAVMGRGSSASGGKSTSPAGKDVAVGSELANARPDGSERNEQ